MSRFIADPQIGFVGGTAVLECSTSILSTTAREFTFEWDREFGISLPLERIHFSQNRQTLVLTDITTEDSNLFLCRVSAPATNERFLIIYRINVFGKLC